MSREPVWVYHDIRTQCFIVKRTPFYYQTILDIETGDTIQVFMSGCEMQGPIWDTVVQREDRWYGTYAGTVYDITDLISGSNPKVE